MSLASYARPTGLPDPGRGTMSSRIARRRECRAVSTSDSFGFTRASGSEGIRAVLTLRRLAIASESARSQASTARTTTRRCICEAVLPTSDSIRSGAQVVRSRSIRTTQGPCRAASLNPGRRRSRLERPPVTYTWWSSRSTDEMTLRKTASSTAPSVAPVYGIWIATYSPKRASCSA